MEMEKDERADAPVPEWRPPSKVNLPALEAKWRQVWDLHLRGWSRIHIADATGLNRNTISKVILRHYQDIECDRKVTLKEKLAAAVERMRQVQRQAWADHDADDQREREVLALMGVGAPPGPDVDRKPDVVSLRYQSQRAMYLRVILEAEVEIARLEGLYEGLLEEAPSLTLIAYCLSAGETPTLPPGTVVDENP
jgi:hypothetical protein